MTLLPPACAAAVRSSSTGLSPGELGDTGHVPSLLVRAVGRLSRRAERWQGDAAAAPALTPRGHRGAEGAAPAGAGLRGPRARPHRQPQATAGGLAPAPARARGAFAAAQPKHGGGDRRGLSATCEPVKGRAKARYGGLIKSRLEAGGILEQS